MTRLFVALLSLLIFGDASPAPSLCPAGAKPEGYAPPDGQTWACVMRDEDGEPLRHGWSVDYWPNGNKKVACEYQHGEKHGRCSGWDEDGRLLGRGRYEAGQRVGYWWFWDLFSPLRDPDGAVARRSAEQLMIRLGAGEDEASVLAQHVLEHAFVVEPDIRAAAQLCSSTLCVSAATVDGRGMLAVQFLPPPAKGERDAAVFAQAAQRAAAAHKGIDRAQQKRDKAREKAENNHEKQVRRWENTRLQCWDGTRSPSCTCGYERQGCCSHHGGVAGCPRDYPEQPLPDMSPLVPNEFVGHAEGEEGGG